MRVKNQIVIKASANRFQQIFICVGLWTNINFFMTHALRLGKRFFTIGVVVTTIAWSIGLAAFLMPLAAQAVAAGDLIKASLPAVYYYGSDGKRYVFPNEKTYMTWYSDFSSVVTVTDDELAAIPIGGNATYKPGVKMVKITTDPKVYAVGAGGSLHWVNSEAVATALYGSDWNKKIDDVPDAFFVNYTVGSDVAAASDFDKAAVMAAATSINVDKGLGETPAVAGGGLSVSLASDTPVSNSVLTDSGGSTDGAQALAPFTTLVFSASSAGSVTVNTVKLKRSGISADTDFSNVYLYDGDTRLSESASFSSTYVTINDASGLFTVPAGGSKKIMVKADLANTTSSIAGKTFRFGLESSADVTSNASSVSGSFPINGNYMTGAQITDLATLTLNTYTTFPATIDPGVTNRELWRFNLVGANWDVAVEYLKLTVVGTVAATDLANIKLTVGGVQMGSTANLNSNKEVVFDMKSSPYVVKAGQTKTVQVMGDVVGGTNRAFKFTVQEIADVVARDMNYSVYLKPNQSDSFTLIQPEAGDGTDINTGTLTVTRHLSSPTGYITLGLTSATVAKFNLKANGEDVKITSLGVSAIVSGSNNTDLNNGKLYLDGVQVGTTTDLDSATADDATQATWGDDNGATDDDTNFTFSNSFIVPAGQTKVLEVVADLVKGNGTTYTANTTVTVHLNQGAYGATADGTAAAANAQGMSSMSSITTSSASGLPLTLSAGTVTVIKNAGFADKSSASPTGVQGGNSVKVNSFVITAGSGEGVDVTQLVLSDYAHPANNNMQNLRLMHGDTRLGTTIGTLNSSSSTYTFAPSPVITIAAGEQYVVDVYADFLTSCTNASEVHYPFSLAANSVTATGKVSGLSATGPAAEVVLQAAYINTGGNLTILMDSDSPTTAQLAFGETDVTLAKFQLRASNAEAVTVTQLVVSDDMTNSQPTNAWVPVGATGTLRNLRLYDGSTLLGTVASLSETNSTSAPYAVFTSLNVNIPKSGSKVLTVKADISPWDVVLVSSSEHRLVVRHNYMYDYDTNHAPANATDNSVIAWGADSGTQLTGASLDFNDEGASIGDTDVDTLGNEFDVLKSKLTIAKHASSPSGSRTPTTQDTVAIFSISNQSPGGFTARVRNLNLDINSSGFSMNGVTARALYVYKSTSYTTANQLATSAAMSDGCTAGGNCEFTDTEFLESEFTDLDVSAGSTQNIYVTLNTGQAADDTTAESLTVGIDSNDLSWDEDAYDGENGVYTGSGTGQPLSECSQSLPLTGNTLTYY